MQVVSGQQMQAIDRFTIDHIGIPSEVLMENAGRSIFHYLQTSVKKNARIGVVCGKGNNGGDGFVVGRYLAEAGFNCFVLLITEKRELKGGALQHYEIMKRSKAEIVYGANLDGEDTTTLLQECDVIVDALLGTGINGAPRQPYRSMIELINRVESNVYAIDIPSGVPANGGAFDHSAVKATTTLALSRPKLGMFTFPAADFYGDYKLLPIGIPKAAIDEILTHESPRIWDRRDFRSTFPLRKSNTHKGSHGKGLMIAGSLKMPGASALCTKAALRSGIGLIGVNSYEGNKPVVMDHALEATFDDEDLSVNAPSQAYDGAAMGPGMGRSEHTSRIVDNLLRWEKTLVVDADALFYLKEKQALLKTRTAPTVLTPHPGEMSQLTGTSIKSIEVDRFGAARSLAKEWNVHVVLKGPYTLIASPDGAVSINTTGNASLAKGGTGDVLTGIIFAFLLQHDDVTIAIKNAVYVHGYTADKLVDKNYSAVSVVARDIINRLPGVMKELTDDTTS